MPWTHASLSHCHGIYSRKEQETSFSVLVMNCLENRDLFLERCWENKGEIMGEKLRWDIC